MWSIKTRLLRSKFLRGLFAASGSRARARSATRPKYVWTVMVTLSIGLSLTLSDTYAQQSLVDQRRDTNAKAKKSAPAQFRSIDEATNHVQGQHPGAKILKVVQRQRDDGSNVAKFRILTADGRMKNISVTFD